MLGVEIGVEVEKKDWGRGEGQGWMGKCIFCSERRLWMDKLLNRIEWMGLE